MTTSQKNIAALRIGKVGKKYMIDLDGTLYPLVKDWKTIFAFNVDKEEWDPTWLLSPSNQLEYAKSQLRKRVRIEQVDTTEIRQILNQ